MEQKNEEPEMHRIRCQRGLPADMGGRGQNLNRPLT